MVYQRYHDLVSRLLLLTFAFLSFLPITEVFAVSRGVVVGYSADADYTSISDALADSATDIFVENGVYEVDDEILIDTPNVSIEGESKDAIIRQMNPDKDLLVIRADSAHISNLTLDASSAQASLVVADSSNTIVENSTFLGSDRTFTVYFAGLSKQAGSQTLEDYYYGHMDSGNVFRNNVVSAPWDGDVLSFALQKEGSLRNNTVIGGKISFYMNRDSEAIGNIVQDSQSHGIEISIPSENNEISKNKVYSPRGSGIRVTAQTEHPISTSERGRDLLIEDNTIIDPLYFGIEIDKLTDSQISKNIIKNPAYEGIYLLRSDSLAVSSNEILETGALQDQSPWYWYQHIISGIFLDYQTSNSTISQNKIVNLEPTAAYAIRLQGDEISGNTVSKNTVSGLFTAESGYEISGTFEDNEIFQNRFRDLRTDKDFLFNAPKSKQLEDEYENSLSRPDAYRFDPDNGTQLIPKVKKQRKMVRTVSE